MTVAKVKPTISPELLNQIDIRVGTIESVSDVANSEKLVALPLRRILIRYAVILCCEAGIMKELWVQKQGETFTILKTAADTNGARVEMAFTLAPAASGPPAHIHTQQVEWFEVVSGKMIATVNKQSHTVQAGQKIEVKAGQTHTFRNGNNESGLELNRVRTRSAHRMAMRQPQKPLVNQRTFSR